MDEVLIERVRQLAAQLNATIAAADFTTASRIVTELRSIFRGPTSPFSMSIDVELQSSIRTGWELD